MAKVFALKGRPSTNPLIVHVADVDAAKRVVTAWPAEAAKLAAAYWPGPLTIVLPKANGLADAVTAGGPTVAVRVPGHPLTLEVLRHLQKLGGVGLAMPSANRSEYVSPTTAAHVRHDLPTVPVLDGGPCDVGIESTVVTIDGGTVQLLRPGGIGRTAVEEVLGVEVASPASANRRASPGQMPRHYAPTTPCRLVESNDLPPPSAGVAVVRVDRQHDTDPQAFGRSLYAELRRLDEDPAVTQIVIEMPPAGAAWEAVRDRLVRASFGSDGDLI